MCLDVAYPLSPPRSGVGYKVVRLTLTNKWTSLCYSRSVRRPFGKWVTAKRCRVASVAWSGWAKPNPYSYVSGFHILAGYAAVATYVGLDARVSLKPGTPRWWRRVEKCLPGDKAVIRVEYKGAHTRGTDDTGAHDGATTVVAAKIKATCVMAYPHAWTQGR